MLTEETWWSEQQRTRFEGLPLRVAHEAIEETVLQHHPDANIALLERAAGIATETHGKRQHDITGRPELRHVLAVAKDAATVGLEPHAVAAAYLHDAPRVLGNTGFVRDELERQFSPRLLHILDMASRPWATCRLRADKVPWGSALSKTPELLRWGPDGRSAGIIQLAERVDDLYFLAPHLPLVQRQTLACQAVMVDAPWAERLGVCELSTALRDQAFKILAPSECQQLAQQIGPQAPVRRLSLSEAVDALKEELAWMDIKATIQWRHKDVYSIHSKMQRTNQSLAQIYDQDGMRIIVETELDCFRVLGLVHSLWYPIPGEFDDYINNPKPNGYQSLHTTVISPAGFAMEIQIRTHEMHERAECGPAAHWHYSIARGDCLTPYAPASPVAHQDANAAPPGNGRRTSSDGRAYTQDSGETRHRVWSVN